MPVSACEALDDFQRAGYRILGIEPEHTLALADLPPHHQDPFDRLLVAQQKAAEGVPLRWSPLPGIPGRVG